MKTISNMDSKPFHFRHTLFKEGALTGTKGDWMKKCLVELGSGN